MGPEGMSVGPAAQCAVLFRMLPGREKVVLDVDVDAVVALMGAVYCGGDAYLVARDSCFFGMNSNA